MKRKHTLRSLLSMVCTIAMILSMVPVLPAAAAEADLLFDNMESYTVGTDVYTQAPDKYTAKSPSWNAVKDAGGSAIVVTDPKDSKNKVIAVSTPGGDSTRYVFSTVPELTGDYTVQFDYMPGDAEGNANSGFMDVYINQGNSHMARIASGLYNTYFNLDKTGCSNVIKNGELDMKNIWYSVRIVVTAGQYVMDIWEKGDEDTMLTTTTTKGTKAIQKAHVEFCIGPYLESQQVGDTSKPITNYIDNIRITPGVVEATDPEDAGDVSVSGGGMVEFVDEYSIVNKEAVAVTAGMGIFSGKDGNRFDPTGELTRAEMATVIVKMLRGNTFNADNFKGVDTFTDTVDYQGGWAEGYINACVQMGIVAGYGDGTFKPGKSVTTAEALTMIINALKVDAGEGDWPSTIMAKAEDMKLYGELKNKPGTYDPLTRDELAVLVYEGMCYSPSGDTGWTVPGTDIIFESYTDAKEFGTPSEVKGQDTLVRKVYDMKIAEGFIVANQDTTDNKYTTVRKYNGMTYTDTIFNMKTSLDQIGHYVTVYYRETYENVKNPGVVYNYVDETEVITVDKAITTSKDYKAVFGASVKLAANVARFDNTYVISGYGAGTGASYTAGSAAATGSYMIYEGEIVAYMPEIPVYAAKVRAISDIKDNETITLSGVTTPISNSKDDDRIREYDGIAKDDYVTYTVVGSGSDQIYFLNQTMVDQGIVSKMKTNTDGDSVITVNGNEYVQFAGSNANEKNDVTEFQAASGVKRTKVFDGTQTDYYLIILSEDGKYIGFEKTESTASLNETAFILGELVVDEVDSYGKSVRNTYARGIDMNGSEVMLLVKVQKNGEVDGGLFFPSPNAADNISDPNYTALSPNTFYSYELSTDKDARKADVYALTAYATAYDKKDAPIYSGTRTIGNGGVYSFNNFTVNGKNTYYHSGTKYIMLEGELTQDEPLTPVVKTSWGTSTNGTGENMYHYYLLSRNASDNQMLDVAVVVVTDSVSAAGNKVYYVSDEHRTPDGLDVNGYVYEVRDYQTGAKKQMTLSATDANVDGSGVISAAGYWHVGTDSATGLDVLLSKVVDTVSGTTQLSYAAGNSTSNDKLYYENILHNQTLVELANNELTTTNLNRGQKASSATVIDVRSEEDIDAAGLGQIKSLDRLATLALDNPEIKVTFDLCYSSSKTQLMTVFITDVSFSSVDGAEISKSGSTYYLDGRVIDTANVVITDDSGRVEGATTTDKLDDLITKSETGTVNVTYNVEGGKVSEITVVSITYPGELFFVNFDNFADGETYTGTTMTGTTASKYTSVTTETLAGDVKALEVTAMGNGSDKIYSNHANSGSYVWETRMKLNDANGYTTIYTTGITTRKTNTGDLANFQLQVGSGVGIRLWRTGNVNNTIVATSDFAVNEWFTVRVTVNDKAGTANDSVCIDVLKADGSTSMGTLTLAGDLVSLGSGDKIGFDVRGNSATLSHTIDIDHVKITEVEEADADTYSVTYEAPANGLIAVDKDTAAEGETVTVTTTAKTGYKLNSLKVNGAEQLLSSDNLAREIETAFTMPADDVTITAEFIRIAGSKVTVTNPAEGTITVTGATDLTNVQEGTVLTITATATNASTHALKAIYVNGNELVGSTYTVPATGEDLAITATFDTVYEIAIVASNGTVTTDKGTGTVAGATVTITATPAQYYELTSVTVEDSQGNPVTVTDNKFTMPADDVTITAVFARKTYTLTTQVAAAGTGTISAGGTKNAGETVTITATPAAGYAVKYIKVGNTVKYTNDNTSDTAAKTYDLTAEDATTVTAVFWPEGAVFHDDFASYATGSFALGGSSTMNKGSNYAGNVTHTINSDGNLVVTASGGTGNRGVVRANTKLSGSYTVEARIKANPTSGNYTMVYLSNVMFPRYRSGAYSTIKYDLRLQSGGTTWIELNAAVAAGAHSSSIVGNKLTGGVDASNKMYLYANGNPNNVVTDAAAVTYTPGAWYTIKLIVDDTSDAVTTELYNASGVLVGSRTLFDAVIGEGYFEIECFYDCTTEIDYITITQ